jgi:presenilin-like A22 family membrane protease
VAAWFVMARLAVEGRAFNGSWVYWLAVGGVIMPTAVVLASMAAGVGPTRRSAGASVLASLIGTILGLLVLHVSREPMPFAILGGFVVSLLATGSYVVASSTDEVARRDREDP